MVTFKSIKAAAQNFTANMGGLFRTPNNESWAYANLRTSDIARGRFTPKDGAAYIPFLRGWVDMCAKKNAVTCSEAELCHYRKGGGGTKIGKNRRRKLRGVKGMADGARDIVEVERSTVLDMLAKPSEEESGADQKLMRFFAKEACGNAFLYLSDSGETMTLRPQFIAPILNDGLPLIRGWVYGRGREREIAIPFENVWQFKHLPNIDSPWLGDGPAKVCSEYAELLIFGTTAEAARWRNGNPPPYAVIIPETITDPTRRDQAVKEIERQVNGPQNAGNKIVLQAADIKNLGFPPKDMEYVEGNRVAAHMVCAAYDVPESLFWPNDSSLATADIALKMYYKTGIWPRLMRDGQQLTELFQSIGMLGENEFLAYDNPSEEDNQSQATYWTGLVDAGLAVVDEAREDMGLEPLAGGLGAIPRYHGTVMSSEAPTQAAGNNDTGKPPAPGDRASPKRLTGDTITKDRSDEKKTRAQVEEDTRDALIVWFLLTLGDVEDSTVTVIPGPEGAPPLAVHSAFIVTPQRTEQLDKILAKGQAEAIRSSISEQSKITGLPKISPTGPIQIADVRRKTMLENITNTTMNDVRGVISNGVTDGKTVHEIAEELKGSGYSTQRATLIAQTEVAYASEVAAKEFATERGLAFKTWYLGPGPCQVCKEIKRLELLAGGAIPTEQRFPLGNGSSIDHPPVHPNCYCTVVYHNRPPNTPPVGGA